MPAAWTRRSGSWAFSVPKRAALVTHHLGEPDDGVERRAQLVAHAGEELRLVLACRCELATLLLDLREQARILDRQHRLGGKGLEQVDGVRSELARRLAADNQRADHLAGSHQRHQQPRTVAGTQNGVVRRRGWRLVQIGYLAGFVPFGRQTDGCRNFGMHVLNAAINSSLMPNVALSWNSLRCSSKT